MIRKNTLLIWLVAVLLLGQIVNTAANVTGTVENEPWGSFYSPGYDDVVSGYFDVSFSVDGYSENISADLYVVGTETYYVDGFYGKGLFNYSWDSTTVPNDSYFFAMYLYDHDYSSFSWMNDTASEFTVSNEPVKLSYVNHTVYNYDTGYRMELVIDMLFEIAHNSTYSFDLTLRNVKGTTTYSPGLQTVYCEIGYEWIAINFPAIIACSDFDGEYIFESLTVNDIDDGDTEALHLEKFDETRDIGLSEIRSDYGKIYYAGGDNHTDWLNDMGVGGFDLIIEVYFEVYYESNYRFELVISDGYGTTWNYMQSLYCNEGICDIEFSFNSNDLMPSGWSDHGGGPFYLDLVTACDQNAASLDEYVYNFGETTHYTPGDLGAEEQVVYLDSFENYINSGIETKLAFRFYFDINKGSTYSGELAIKDNRGVIWYAGWTGEQYMSEGYRWLGPFELPVDDILEANFTGSQFYLHNLKIYNQNGSILVSDIWDFGNTRYYSRDEFEGSDDVAFYGEWEDTLDYIDDTVGIIFSFRIDIFKSSNYRFEVGIRDNSGHTWDGDSEAYCYGGIQWVNVPFWADYILGEDFDGGVFYVDHFRILDKNDYNREVLSVYNLGQTDYYSSTDFTVVMFGIKAGDVIAFNFTEFDATDGAKQVLYGLFIEGSTGYTGSGRLNEGDFVKYTITRIESSTVYATVNYGGLDYGEITLYTYSEYQIGFLFLMSLNEINNIHEKMSPEATLIDHGDSYEISYSLNGTYQSMTYNKSTGVMTKFVLYNLIQDDYTINSLVIDGYITVSAVTTSTEDSEDTTSSGFTFSTPGYEMLLVLVVLPVIAMYRKKHD